MNAIRFPDIAEDATLATSRAQLAADPELPWPVYEVLPIGGLWNELQGWKVMLVSGPILIETDGVLYGTYSDALAARSLLEEAEEPRPEPAVEAMMVALTERQQRADYYAEEADADRQFGRAGGFFPDEDEVD